MNKISNLAAALLISAAFVSPAEASNNTDAHCPDPARLSVLGTQHPHLRGITCGEILEMKHRAWLYNEISVQRGFEASRLYENQREVQSPRYRQLARESAIYGCASAMLMDGGWRPTMFAALLVEAARQVDQVWIAADGSRRGCSIN